MLETKVLKHFKQSHVSPFLFYLWRDSYTKLYSKLACAEDLDLVWIDIFIKTLQSVYKEGHSILMQNGGQKQGRC